MPSIGIKSPDSVAYWDFVFRKDKCTSTIYTVVNVVTMHIPYDYSCFSYEASYWMSTNVLNDQ